MKTLQVSFFSLNLLHLDGVLDFIFAILGYAQSALLAPC